MSAILVAVDLSEASRSPVDVASQIAQAKGIPLDLYHVLVSAIPARVKVHSPANIRKKMDSGEREDATRALLALMEEAVPRGTQGRCLIGEGEPAQSVCDQAKSGYEMVVVSTQGRRGLEHVVLGSVAERVVRFATVPVLVVR